MSARGCLVTLFVANCGRVGFDTVRDSTPACQLTAVAVGKFHTCVLHGDGSVACWGSNERGQLAMPAGPPPAAAVPIALAGPATAISAGANHTCAVLADQSVGCWGVNGDGQLGDGTKNPHAGIVVALPAGSATAVAAGAKHTCALLVDGTVKCWGGQIAPPTPTTVAGVSGATELVSGHRFACAREGSGIACWGEDSNGELGRGTIVSGTQPAAAVTGITDAVAISAGGRFACAREASGSVVCWGNNDTGELGIGMYTTSVSMPGTAVGLPGIAQLAGASRHACALLTDGSVQCWGDNQYGSLGTGDFFTHDGPTVPVIGVANARAIASGYFHECAILGDGTLGCWGWNQFGQLGDGTRSISEVPVQAMIPDGASVLGGMDARTCAVYPSGAVWCWGHELLGDGNDGWAGVPILVPGLSSIAIASGIDYTCARDQGGQVQCWGYNFWGQLGDGTTTQHYSPKPITGALVASHLAGGFQHSCVVTSAGTVFCWGHNPEGRIGDNTTTDRNAPTAVMGLPSAATSTALGLAFSCAVLANGGVSCWGANDRGQLGDGTTTPHSTAKAVSGVSGATALAAGWRHACAITSSGVMCWGDGGAGQLGNGMLGQRTTPVAVSLPAAATTLVAGELHTCALLSDQSVWCWGFNDHGQLGMPGVGMTTTPAQVPNLAATAITAGHYYTCIIATDGRTLCWGDNVLGSLGDGATVAGSMARTATFACP
jgi:alpha-tubulin suppressor-like RCC1 family protein